MPSEPQYRWLEVEPVDAVTVVRFTQRLILDEEAIASMGRELLRLVEDPGCRRLVLNFRAVETVATYMLGELLVLHKKVQAVGGRLALCEFNPQLWEVFEVLKLNLVFNIHDTQPEAVQSLGPAPLP